MSEQDWIAIGKSIGSFFVNPLLWAAILAAIALGYFRVKRERRDFTIRLLPGLTEMRRLLAESWLPALLVSVIVSGVGLAVDKGWLVLFMAIMLIMLVTFYYQAMSPVYAIAGAVLALYGVSLLSPDFSYRGWFIANVDLFGGLTVTVPVIAGLLLIAEGFLVRRHAEKYASPYLEPTNRGLRAAVFKAKRLWLLPVVFLIPGDFITAYVPYWPQFTLGGTAFTLLPVPILIGFSQVARKTYPEELFPRMGRAIAWTGIAVALIGIAALWMPILGWAALIIGVACRAAISIQVAVRERKGRYVAAPQAGGVVIAGILPDSPGDRLGLMPGECIRSVNGIQVMNEKELYDAIQVNAAHCRLQVIGRDGEVRLMQQVLYHHDHHRLGLLVVR